MPPGQPGAWFPLVASGITGIILALAWFIFGRRSWIATIAVVCVLLARPGVEIALWAERAPAGVLALIASFGLFAIGTGFALRRQRRHAGKHAE
jgi:hypothetical protein